MEKCVIYVDKEKAVEWLKNNEATNVGDTPLWVIISMGIIALNAINKTKQQDTDKGVDE